LPDSAGKEYSDATCNYISYEYAGKLTASCNKIIASSGSHTFIPAYLHDANDAGSDDHGNPEMTSLVTQNLVRFPTIGGPD